MRDLLLIPNLTPPTLRTPDAVVRLDNEADSLFINQALHNDLETVAGTLAAEVAGTPPPSRASCRPTPPPTRWERRPPSSRPSVDAPIGGR